MKHIFGKLTAFFLITGIFLASCSDISEISDEKATVAGTAKISLSLGLRSLDDESTIANDNATSRTVVAKADDNKVATLTDIALYAKTSASSAVLGSSDTLLATWETYSALQTSPYSETITAGTYDFMVTAKNYGAMMTQTLSNRTISSGSTTSLNFTSLSASETGEQTGAIDITLSYSSTYINTNFKKFVTSTYEDRTYTYPAISISLDGTVIATKDSTKSSLSSSTSSYSSELTPDENGNAYSIGWASAEFSKKSLSAGFHTVTFTFTAPDSSVFVYPVAVYVDAGYLSKETIYPFSSTQSVSQDANASSHTVTYNSNTTSATTATQTFYDGSSIADAEALGFSSDSSSKRFKEWNTLANGNGTAYKAGDTPALTGNVTLYAQWAEFTKITYLINLETKDSYNQTVGRTESYVQQYESGNALVPAATAFAGADLTYYSQTKSSKETYTFCGWDTQADGSGTRYAAGTTPALSEDTILYAQWCGAKLTNTSTSWIYYGYYEVCDVKQWNALMGSSLAKATDGTISVNIVFAPASSSSNSVTIASPVLKHTSTKTFSGKITNYSYYAATFTGLSGVLFNEIADGAEISSIKLGGPLCNTNKGTIKNVTVSGVTMTGYAAIAKENVFTGTISSCTVSNCTITGTKSSGDVGYVGAVCNENYGTISDCKVTNCTVDGEANNLMYTGGICGYNGENATISGTTNLLGTGNTQVSGTVKGKSSGESYTGGYTGYNAGTISGTGSVDIILSGSDDTNGHYGYVIGSESSSATTSTEITTNASETIFDTGTIEVDDYRMYTIVLERTSLVSATFTDTSANVAALYGYISSKTTNSNGTPTSYYVSSGKVDATSVTKKVYLQKGTYYVFLDEGYATTNKGCSATVTID